MSRATPIAVLGAGLLIAGAIVYHTQVGRYQLAVLASGMLARIDTRTGDTAVCLPQRAGDGETFVIPCNGRRGRD
jgi:hypothetical protein